MEIPIFHVDAFTDILFTGNPAAVCVLPHWLSELQLRQIAQENNLPVTAFITPHTDHYEIRWLTPENELTLCGHGSMAAAHIIFHYLAPTLPQIKFIAKDGLELFAERADEFTVLNFPAKPPIPADIPTAVLESLDFTPQQFLHFHQERCLIVLENEQQLKAIQPAMQPLTALPYYGYTFTAPGDTVDFVSRTFYPQKTIPEDAVTGASHCLLTPYWAKHLAKNKLQARQLSQRGGFLRCELQQDRVLLASQVVLYLEGKLII